MTEKDFPEGVTVEKLKRWENNRSDRYQIFLDGKKFGMIYESESIGWILVIHEHTGRIKCDGPADGMAKATEIVLKNQRDSEL